MVQTIFYIILAIVIVDFVVEQWLDYLNSRHFSLHLPDELKGIYNETEYRKSQAYQKVNHRFGMLTSSFSFLLILLMLLFNGFALVDAWAVSVSNHYILNALIFFALLGLASDLLTTPFESYHTFVIEEKFGFNKTTVKTFVSDKLKGWLLGAILGGGLLALIIWIWHFTGSWFWIIAWGVITVITVLMSMFYSSIIVPLFNKQKALEEGPLKEAIEDFASRAGFVLNNIYVIDGSKRSTRANAYFTGLGKRKRIVLYDTLINDLSTDELVAVLAHEIGHYKHRHIISGLLAGVLQTGLMLYILSLLIDSQALSQALGADEAKFHLGIIAFGLLYAPLAFVTGLLMNVLSRRNEYQADAYAAGFGLAGDLASALKKLSVKNLSNLMPHPWYVFFNYSHPTLLQRLEKLKNK